MKEIKNERGYNYIEFYSGSHNHIKTRLWLNIAILGNTQANIEFPINGAKIISTKKGSLVAVPENKTVIYYVQIPSGYRGDAQILTITPASGETEIMATGFLYHSGQGALGKTAWALVNAESQIEVHGERTGRRIADEEVNFILTPYGDVEYCSADKEVYEILND